MQRYSTGMLPLFMLVKFKYYLLSWSNALKTYWYFTKEKTPLSLDFLKAPFYLRFDEVADIQVFNEVILRKSYFNLLGHKNRQLRIIDIGAHIGLASICFLNEYPNSYVVAIEPENDNFCLLQKNLSPYLGRTKIMNNAIMGSSGNCFIYDNKSGTHGYQIKDNHEDGRFEVKQIVNSLTLENLLSNLEWSKVDILKIDIEGAEKDLFQSDISWLKSVGCLVIETHDRIIPDCTKVLFESLRNFSYSLKVKDQNLIFYLNH